MNQNEEQEINEALQFCEQSYEKYVQRMKQASYGLQKFAEAMYSSMKGTGPAKKYQSVIVSFADKIKNIMAEEDETVSAMETNLQRELIELENRRKKAREMEEEER